MNSIRFDCFRGYIEREPRSDPLVSPDPENLHAPTNSTALAAAVKMSNTDDIVASTNQPQGGVNNPNDFSNVGGGGDTSAVNDPTTTTHPADTADRPHGWLHHHKDKSAHPHPPHQHKDPFTSRHDGINNDANYDPLSGNSFRSQGGDGINGDQNFTPDELFRHRG